MSWVYEMWNQKIYCWCNKLITMTGLVYYRPYIHCIAVHTFLHTTSLFLWLSSNIFSLLVSILQCYLSSHGSRVHPGSLCFIRVWWPDVSLGAWWRLILPQSIERLLSSLNCSCSHRLLILTCFGPILKGWVKLINRKEPVGLARQTCPLSSSLKPFIWVQREGACTGGLGLSVWKIVRGCTWEGDFFQHLNVFMLMSLISELYTPLFGLDNLP